MKIKSFPVLMVNKILNGNHYWVHIKRIKLRKNSGTLISSTISWKQTFFFLQLLECENFAPKECSITSSIISAHFFPIRVCRSSSFGWFFNILPGLACAGQFLCIIAQLQHAECHFPKRNWVVNINFGKFSHATC